MAMLNCIYALFLINCFTISVQSQQKTQDGCYREYQNSKVSCMDSFMSQTVSSTQDCTDLCTKNSVKCKAAQFATDTKSCQLYDSALPVNSQSNRKRRASGCYGYGPSIVYYPGYIYYVPTGYGCSGNGGMTSTTATTSMIQSTAQTTPSTTYTTTVQTTPPTTYTSTDPTTSTTQAPTSSTVSDQTLPPETTCTTGQLLRYTVIDGYRLSGQPDFTFQANDLQTCLTACTNNRLPDGRQAPCRSADYNSNTQQCAISMRVTPPIGTNNPEQNAGYRHFEKVCVDATVAQNCQGPYFRSPQHILVGYAQAVATASSTIECLQLCASAQSRFSFVCISGMFYFTESSNNCILNSESRSTHPDLFLPENTDRVEYFEPGCTVMMSKRGRRQVSIKIRNRNILQLNKQWYSGWTLCDGMVRSHMRFRQCKSYDPNKCQIDHTGCDPKRENDYDLDIDKITNSTQPLENGISVPTPVAPIDVESSMKNQKRKTKTPRPPRTPKPTTSTVTVTKKPRPNQNGKKQPNAKNRSTSPRPTGQNSRNKSNGKKQARDKGDGK